MGSSIRLFGRQRTVHEILGGGFIADVILWRRRDLTVGILLGTPAVWVLFELSGYTLLSLVSNVLLLLFSILFVWAKCAEVLNRPAPSIPELHLSEEVMNKAAVLVQSQVNAALSVFCSIALGKDPKIFYRVATCLLLISAVGSCTNVLLFAYSSLVLVLTVPLLYEKFEDTVDRYVMLGLIKLHMYEIIYAECFSKAKEWVIEKLKEC